MAICNSYVKLPEGIWRYFMGYLSSHILGLGLSYSVVWRFPKMELPQWLDGSVKPINVDDLGVPPF